MNPSEVLAKLPSRIASRILVAGTDECWPWTGSCDSSGYGHVRLHGKLPGVHRLVLEAKLGRSLEVGEESRHSCDNPPCCNPAHLEEGSHIANVQDMVQRGRFRPSFGDQNGARLHPESRSRGDAHYARTCPELLARGASHGRAKLADFQIRSAFVLRKQGKTLQTIAEHLGCSRTHASRILRGKCWSHLDLSL